MLSITNECVDSGVRSLVVKRTWIAVLLLPLFGGCVSPSPQATVATGTKDYAAFGCQTGSDSLVSAITAQKDLGGHGPYNLTVVQFSPDWEVIAYGYGAASLDIYLAEPGSTDTSSWSLVSSDGVDHWNTVSLPSDLLTDAKSAADMARSCTMGG
jgi:hypothetical protein